MINVFQKEDEYRAFRAKYFTSSESYPLMTDPKSGDGLSVGAMTYVRNKIVERLAPVPDRFYSMEMQRGNELEPQAVLKFAAAFGWDVNDDKFIYTSIGGHVFVINSEFHSGGTPDVILPHAIVEIKCPNSATHLSYLLLENVEQFRKLCPEYYHQIQMNMWLCKKEKAYFVSYDDRFFNSGLHLFVLPIEFDYAYIAKLSSRLLMAANYQEQLLNKIGL